MVLEKSVILHSQFLKILMLSYSFWFCLAYFEEKKLTNQMLNCNYQFSTQKFLREESCFYGFAPPII